MKYNQLEMQILTGVLKQYIENEELKAMIFDLISSSYEIAPMKVRVERVDVHDYVCDKLRITHSKYVHKIIRLSLNDLGVKLRKIEGYYYFLGLRKKEITQNQ